MPLYRQFELAGVDIVVWKITESVDELLGMVPAECASYALVKFRSERRCAEWLAVRAIVARWWGDAARVVYDSAGRPSLDGVGQNISISHTKGYAVVAFSSANAVGVDVELLSRDVVAVAGRFMSAGMLEDVLPEKKNFVALVHWCAKEALYKIVGDLGGDFKDNIYVGEFQPRDEGRVAVTMVGLDGYDGVGFFADYAVLDDLLIVMCHGRNGRTF